MGMGPDDLDAALAGVIGSLSGAELEPIVRRAMEPAAEHARAHVAVQTGKVRDAIAITSHHTQRTATASVVVLGSTAGGQAREALFLELGTSKMAAEPFLRPALAATQGDIASQISAGLAGILKPHE